MTGELLVSLDEAARRLGLCRRSVQHLIYAGELPSMRIGRSRRVAVVDLEGFVERLRQEDDHEVELATDEPGTNYPGVTASGTSPNRLPPMA